MKRNHIHLAQDVAGQNVVSGMQRVIISQCLWVADIIASVGMRNSSQILIFINIQKALDAGTPLTSGT